MQVESTVCEAQTDTVEVQEIGTDCEQVETMDTETQTFVNTVTVDASTDYTWPVSDEASQTELTSYRTCETQTHCSEQEPLATDTNSVAVEESKSTATVPLEQLRA